MKVKATRLVEEEIEIPDEKFENAKNVSSILSDYYSDKTLTKEAYKEYVEEEGYIFIETLDGKTIAER